MLPFRRIDPYVDVCVCDWGMEIHGGTDRVIRALRSVPEFDGINMPVDKFISDVHHAMCMVELEELSRFQYFLLEKLNGDARCRIYAKRDSYRSICQILDDLQFLYSLGSDMYDYLRAERYLDGHNKHERKIDNEDTHKNRFKPYDCYKRSSTKQRDLEQPSRSFNNIPHNHRKDLAQCQPDPETGEGTLADSKGILETCALKINMHSNYDVKYWVENEHPAMDTSDQLEKSTHKKIRASVSQRGIMVKDITVDEGYQARNQPPESYHLRNQVTSHTSFIRENQATASMELVDAAHSSLETQPTLHESNDELQTSLNQATGLFSLIDAGFELLAVTGEVYVQTPLSATENLSEATVMKMPAESTEFTVKSLDNKLAVPIVHHHDTAQAAFDEYQKERKIGNSPTVDNAACQNVESTTAPTGTRQGVG